MAYAESQPTVSLIAESTFSSDDLYKFIVLSTANGKVNLGSTGGEAYGTLLSETYSTSTGADETVTIGLLQGIGQVYMAGSTSHAGNIIGASSKGYGIALTTDTSQIGMIVEGSSGSTGRIHSVAFGVNYDL